MSDMGQKATSVCDWSRSALPPTADIEHHRVDVR